MDPERIAAGEPEAWAHRRASNLRLAWILAGVAFALFLFALWKFRPI